MSDPGRTDAGRQSLLWRLGLRSVVSGVENSATAGAVLLLATRVWHLSPISALVWCVSIVTAAGLLVKLWWIFRSARTTRAVVRLSALRMTNLAVFLAGRRGPALRYEWRAHLAGESGNDPVTWHQVKDACGFVRAALEYRLTDAAKAAWTPVDAILKSRKLSNLATFGPTALAALFILRHLGTLGVLTSAESIAAIGGALYGLIRTGRWWRDVKPPEPKARRARE